MYEWIPVKIRIHGLFKNRELKKLTDLMVTPSIINHNEKRTEPTSGETMSLMGCDVYATIESGNNGEKQIRYQEMLTSMLQDQWAWIKDKRHERTIDDDNGLEALKMAEHAKEVAQNF